MKNRFYKQASTGIAFLMAMSFLVSTPSYQASETQGDETTEATTTVKPTSEDETQDTSSESTSDETTTSDESSSTSESSPSNESSSSVETTPAVPSSESTAAKKTQNPAYARFDLSHYASQIDYAPERAAALRSFFGNTKAHVLSNMQVKLSAQVMGQAFNAKITGDYAQNLASSARASFQVAIDSALVPSDESTLNLDFYLVPKLNDENKMEVYLQVKSSKPSEGSGDQVVRFEFDRSAMAAVQANSQTSPEATAYFNALTMKLKSSSPDEDVVTLLIPVDDVFKLAEAEAMKTTQTESEREQTRKGMELIREIVKKVEDYAAIDKLVIPMEIHFGQDNKIHRLTADLGDLVNLLIDFAKHEEPQMAKQLDVHVSEFTIDQDLSYQDTEIPIAVPENVKNMAVDLNLPTIESTTASVHPTTANNELTQPTTAVTGTSSEATTTTENSSSTEETSTETNESSTSETTETETSSPTETANAATTADR